MKTREFLTQITFFISKKSTIIQQLHMTKYQSILCSLLTIFHLFVYAMATRANFSMNHINIYKKIETILRSITRCHNKTTSMNFLQEQAILTTLRICSKQHATRLVLKEANYLGVQQSRETKICLVS